MTRIHTTIALATLAALGLAAAPAAHAQTLPYTFQAISVPNNQSGTFAKGVSASGTVVGYSDLQGFVYNGGTFTTLNVPGAGSTFAEGINSTGTTIVGFSDDTNGTLAHGFTDTAGTFTSFDAPAAVGSTYATGINDAGQTIGFYNDANFATHSYLKTGSVYTTLDDSNAAAKTGGTQAFGINNTGQIVGFFHDTAGNGHGFLFSQGTFTTLDFPGATETFAYGINDVGQTVGYYRSGGSTFNHGFVYDGTTFTTVDFPSPSAQTTAYGINNSGQIVGIRVFPSGSTSGFLATPVAPAPEPSQFAAFGVGLLGLGALALKARKRHAA